MRPTHEVVGLGLISSTTDRSGWGVVEVIDAHEPRETRHRGDGSPRRVIVGEALRQDRAAEIGETAVGDGDVLRTDGDQERRSPRRGEEGDAPRLAIEERLQHPLVVLECPGDRVVRALQDERLQAAGPVESA